MTASSPTRPQPSTPSNVAVVLTGGGARAAYQVGFLRWIARNIPEVSFPIVTGVSAGAINAAFLASYPGSHAAAIEHLAQLWQRLSIDQVFRVDAVSLVSHVARWGLRLVSGGGVIAPRVRGLVDTTPLRHTLETHFELAGGRLTDRINDQLRSRQLWALAVGTSSYSTGQSVVWTQGRNLSEWERPKRRSQSTGVTTDHVMASAALPLFFPAVALEDAWYGDGGMRLTAPCSPAIHLGATRILALSTLHLPSRAEADTPMSQGYPPPAQILGQLLNAIFLDDLDRDAKELDRINMLLRETPHEKRRGLRPIQLMVARPSRDLATLVTEFEPRLPGLFRHLIRSLGAREPSPSDILSLLVFDPDYLTQLIEVGESDAEARAEEIHALLRGDDET